MRNQKCIEFSKVRVSEIRFLGTLIMKLFMHEWMKYMSCGGMNNRLWGDLMSFSFVFHLIDRKKKLTKDNILFLLQA